jgi:hypothetical protein
LKYSSLPSVFVVLVAINHPYSPNRANGAAGAAAAAPLLLYPWFTNPAGLRGKTDRAGRAVFAAGSAKNVLPGQAALGDDRHE